MKKLLLAFFSSCLIGNVNAQWLPQTAPNPSNNLFSVFAIDPNAVAATGFTGPIRTANAGGTWSQNITLGGVNSFEVHTRNPLKWYVLTQNSSWFMKVGNPAGVTLNSGKPDSILSLHFINMNCGIAVGTAGKIEATCDTGATWQYRSSGTTANLNAVWFADADTGCTVGANGTIKRTKDAGATWTNITSGTTAMLNGIHFPTQTVGYIVGNGGKIFKSMDAGATWTNVPSGVLNQLNGVYFIDQDTGYVVGTSGLIMKTMNGGVNWFNMTSGTAQTLNSVHFATPVDGWAVGNAGTILKYNGSAGLGINTSSAETHFNMYPNPAKDVIHVVAALPTSGIKIFNALGGLMYETIAGNEETKIDISFLTAGVYFIECRNADNVSVKKFVKE